MIHMKGRTMKTKFFPWVTLILSVLLGPAVFFRVAWVLGKSAHPVLELLGFTVLGFALTWTIYAVVMVCFFPVIKRLTQRNRSRH